MRAKRTGPYRSKFEHNFHQSFPELKFEQEKIKYVKPASNHTYLPDWKLKDNVYLETKGRFTKQDRDKYLLVKQQHPEITIIFIFQKNLKLGSRLGTCLEWSAKHNFPAFLASDTKAIKEFLNHV